MFFFLLLLLTGGRLHAADPPQTQIFYPHAAPCSRLYSLQTAFGCSSAKAGNSGVLTWINSTALLTTAALQTWLTQPTAIVITWDMFAEVNMTARIDDLNLVKNLVQAMVVVQANNISSSATGKHDPAAPSQYNPAGTGLLQKNVGFPVLLLSTQDSTSFNNGDVMGQQLTVNFYMGPDNMNSSKCLALGMCLPLGGQSVWGTLGQARVSSATRMVLVTARMDSKAFFHDYSFAAFTANTDVAVLLTALHAIAKLGNDVLDGLPLRISGAIFQGEAWHRLGSRRFVYDISSGSGCKLFSGPRNVSCLDPPTYNLEWSFLSLSSFERIVALDLVLRADDANHLVVHTSPAGKDMTFASRMATRVGATTTLSSNSPPESAWTSFMENTAWNASMSTVGMVLTAYDTSYQESAPRYFSERDIVPDVTSVIAGVTRIANQLARALVLEAADGQVSVDVTNLVADEAFATNVINCVMGDFSTCQLAQDTFPATHDDLTKRMSNMAYSSSQGVRSSGPLTMYSGVYVLDAARTGLIKTTELFMRNALLNATMGGKSATVVTNATIPCIADVDCRDSWSVPASCNVNVNSSTACIAGMCMCSMVFYHDAWSTSLEFDTATSTYVVKPGSSMDNDPVWTEPNWQNAVITTYAQTNAGGNAGALVFGIFLTIFAIVGSIAAVRVGKTNPKYKLL